MGRTASKAATGLGVLIAAVTVGASALAPAAGATGGLSTSEAERIARKAAYNYTHAGYGAYDWRAYCRVVRRGGPPGHWQTFSCSVSVGARLCTGRLKVSERQFRAYAIRINCGDSG